MGQEGRSDLFTSNVSELTYRDAGSVAQQARSHPFIMEMDPRQNHGTLVCREIDGHTVCKINFIQFSRCILHKTLQVWHLLDVQIMMECILKNTVLLDLLVNRKTMDFSLKAANFH